MKRCVWISLGIAGILWFFVFILRPLNFWLMMSVSTLVLSVITLLCGSLKKADLWPTLKDLILGIGSAAALYGIFYLGNVCLAILEGWFPHLPIERSQNIANIYANLGRLSPGLVAGLLFFPIGFGEEFFWRGFIQKYFADNHSSLKAFIWTTALYVAVHLVTANPVLLMAALVCGLFWGGLYHLTGRLPAVLISHMIWDPFIFILFPIR